MYGCLIFALQSKNEAAGIALRRRRRVSQERPAAGKESCLQDSFLFLEKMLKNHEKMSIK